MTFLNRFIRIILVVAINSALGLLSAGFAAQGDWSQINYSIEAQNLDAQPVNLAFAPRAPPTTSGNLTSTGPAFAQTGSLRALDGAGTTGAVYALLRSSIATNSAGRNGSMAGSVGDANFAQTSIRSDRTFSADGQQIYSDLAGYEIRTVDDLSAALRKGDISPADVPVDYVDMNGTRLILNTRTSTALQDAGIPQSQWYGTQRTGQTAYTDAAGNSVTYSDLATNQLNNNGLPPTGSPTLPTRQ